MSSIQSEAKTFSLPGLYAPIQSQLHQAQQRFDEELTSEYPCVERLCDCIQAYRGKMLRPALLLLSGQACGKLNDAHPVLAAVVEMVHMATLVHDDVLDEADQRRKQPTISAAEGNVTAVLLGDYLISHAFHLCSSLKDQHASRRVGATTNIVCEGELLQNAHRGDFDLSERDYLNLIRCKTGELTAVACELGAHEAGADAPTVNHLREFGLHIGIAFQIIDDVLDIFGNPQEVGKTLALDFSLGKMTLPVIHYLTQSQPAQTASLRSAYQGEIALSQEEFRKWLDGSGSDTYAIKVASQYVQTALTHLEAVPPSESKNSLIALAEFIIARHF